MSTLAQHQQQEYFRVEAALQSNKVGTPGTAPGYEAMVFSALADSSGKLRFDSVALSLLPAICLLSLMVPLE